MNRVRWTSVFGEWGRVINTLILGLGLTSGSMLEILVAFMEMLRAELNLRASRRGILSR